jgi:cytochrome c biogenesis protein CcdA/thiol-disulfide isomerase/thioredoxin
MILILAVFLSGVLTILSPCILPVLPFVFARSEQKFLTSGLPLLIGMAATFAGIATLAAVGGAWAVRVNQYGRLLAMLLLAAFAATLLSRRLANWFARPFVALGNRLLPPGTGSNPRAGIAPSLLLGVATGFLWAPCAGPILGLVLTGAAISGPNAHTTALLFAYAAGAATSLAVAILAGARIFGALKRSLGAGEWIRRALGVAILLAVAAIALGWDSSVLTRLSFARTNHLEQSLIDAISPGGTTNSKATNDSMAGGQAMMMSGKPPEGLPIEGEIPSLAGATTWLNSPALSAEELRGKVVLVDFWTYSCINCLRALPYVKTWYAKYKDHGLVVIGVHAPEFAFEKDPANVRRAVSELGVSYPVALDNNYAIWQAFNNHYWPAHYFFDAAGHIRGHHFGEGNYEESERTIRELLAQGGYTNLPPPGMQASVQASVADGLQAPPDEAHDQSPETYIGYARAQNFSSPGGFVHDHIQSYAIPPSLDLNQWALGGTWLVDNEKAASSKSSGKIVFRFYARDLHLVLGPAPDGKPIRFRVQLDGSAPGANHGVDTDTNGAGQIKEQRLYQLIRQSAGVGEHVFSIEFLDPDVQAYSFTFG